MRTLTLVVLGLLLLAGAGCNSGPRVAKVTGRVTYAGKPVTGGQITFHAEGGRPALGEIQSDGTYTLTTFKPNDGAIVGKHVVTIMATKVGGGSVNFATAEEEQRWTEQGMKNPNAKILVPGKVEWLVPEIYSQPQTTKLRAEVKDEENVINFDLEK